MSRTTTVRDAEGNLVSTSTTRSGCGSGCGWWLTALVAIYVVAAPAMYFHPLIWEVLAYAFEGVVALAALAAYLGRWSARRRRSRAQ
ncbi:MAG: hypothetical protein ACRENY_02370 [Candidatus Dormibacteria bacterium]